MVFLAQKFLRHLAGIELLMKFVVILDTGGR